MSNTNLVPSLPAPELVPAPTTDGERLALEARLKNLRAAWASRPQYFQPPRGDMSEVELTEARRAWEETSKLMIREQIEILAVLRRTSAGPARKGGTRAKKAPLDLGAFLAKVASA